MSQNGYGNEYRRYRMLYATPEQKNKKIQKNTGKRRIRASQQFRLIAEAGLRLTFRDRRTQKVPALRPSNLGHRFLI